MHSRPTARHRDGIVLLAAALVSLLACGEPKPEAPGLSPIEQAMQEDSLIDLGQEPFEHVGFDYENLNRVAWQKPDLVLDRLGPLKDRVVVEIGSGTGFFTRRLANRGARVFAVDIDPGMLLRLDSLNRSQLSAEAYQRVEPIRGQASDPRLPQGVAHAALVVNTFMYIDERQTYLERLGQALLPSSPVVVVDFKRESTPIGPPVTARLHSEDVVDSMRGAGLVDIEVDEQALDFQYIVTGRVPD